MSTQEPVGSGSHCRRLTSASQSIPHWIQRREIQPTPPSISPTSNDRTATCTERFTDAASGWQTHMVFSQRGPPKVDINPSTSCLDLGYWPDSLDDITSSRRLTALHQLQVRVGMLSFMSSYTAGVINSSRRQAGIASTDEDLISGNYTYYTTYDGPLLHASNYLFTLCIYCIITT